MRIAFINPQGNFDPDDSYWTAHPDFGGQLVYVKELALAMGNLGHEVDIVTRRIIDPDWPEFSEETDSYPDAPNVRILRISCGPGRVPPQRRAMALPRYGVRPEPAGSLRSAKALCRTP